MLGDKYKQAYVVACGGDSWIEKYFQIALFIRINTTNTHTAEYRVSKNSLNDDVLAFIYYLLLFTLCKSKSLKIK